jgi:radical SAM protein with 4Fe4S-binding SPASM domain
MITLDSVISRHDERIACRRLNSGNSIVVHYDSLREFRVSGTGLFIWNLIGGDTPVSRIVASVSSKYNVIGGRLQPDIIAYLSEMYEGGLIKIDGSYVNQEREMRLPRLMDTDPVFRQIATEGNIPYMTNFVLSYKCNLHCNHCYIPAMRDLLDTSEIKRILDQLADLRGIFVRFTGGEPFLRKDILEVLSHAKMRGFAVAVNTNGFFITEDVANALRRIYPMDVNISVYGCKPQTHDLVTQRKGSLEVSLRAIELLRSAGVNVNINYVVMNHNVDEMEQVKSWAEERGVGFRPEYSIFPKRDGDKKPLCHRATNQQLIRIFRAGLIREPKPTLCKPASIKLRIDPNGTVHPCEMLDYDLGNLKEKSLAQIWNSHEVQEFRAINIQSPAKCSSCRLKDICFRCAGIAQMEDGGMHLPSSWACKVSHLYEYITRAAGSHPS